VEIPPERMSALARRRAEGVRDALVATHAIDAGRFEIAEAGEAGAPGVLLELIAAAAG
jgi:outer membrane protein OmpA-like peptidoglycan-associated protein